MTDDAAELNPYAPPKPEADGGPRRGRRRRTDRDGIREALERLDAHLSDPEAVAYDRKVAGPRVRVVTAVFLALLVPCLVLVVLGIQETHGAMLPIGAGLSIVLAILGIAFLVLDLSIVEQGKPSSPDLALKSFFKAISSGRFGRAWAALCPTAREQSVVTPSLGPIVTDGLAHELRDQAGMKAYANGFARPGQGHIRTMQAKQVTVRSVDDDVAQVDAVLLFQAWPQWVSAVMAVGFIVFRPLGLVGLILFFVMRKKHEVRITKTLLQGKNGAWYLYSPDVIEGAEEP